MRCGRKIGTREPMRRNSTCSIARRRLEQRFQLVVGEQQRIAAGKQHVAHFRVRLDVADRLLEIGVEFLLARAADDPAAGAIPAVARATVRHEKQHAVRVAMHESRHGHVAVLAAGIGHLERAT